jgi:membrane protease YdiL (CAAX protease family)
LPLKKHFDTSFPTLPSAPPAARITTLALIIYGSLALVALAWAWLASRRPAWSLETPWLSEPYGARLMLSLALGLALALLVVAATPALIERTAWGRALREALKQVVDPLTSTQVRLLAVASGFSEELFFRGAMQPVLGLWITSAIFGVVHVGPKRALLAWMGWAFVMGLLFGLLFELTGVLWGAVLAHVWINERNMAFLQRH